MNFLTVEKKRQLAWKLSTKTLPREAKVPGLYYSRLFPFCLPLEHAALNLYQGIRDEALALFKRGASSGTLQPYRASRRTTCAQARSFA